MSGPNLTPIEGSGQAHMAGHLSLAVRRIRTIIMNTALDCNCRDRVDSALQRFETLEQLRDKKRFLDDARQQRRTIEAILELLREIDELGFQDMDEGVLAEATLLFEDIATAPTAGSQSIKLISMSSPVTSVRYTQDGLICRADLGLRVFKRNVRQRRRHPCHQKHCARERQL